MQPSHRIAICDNCETTTSGSTIVTPRLEIPEHEADSEAPSPLQSRNLPLQHHAISKRTLQCSPDRSPHKVGKIGPKRKRTIAVKNLTSELQGTSTNTVVHRYTQSLTMADFEESGDEQIEQQTLCKKLFSYILLKYTNDFYADSRCVLSEMRQFLDNEDNERTQPSKVYYMDLINENPDSDDTMCLVAEDLLEKFETKLDGWVVLVGDGKTYQYLQNIKQQYGKAFEKLIVFPGDWHTLKNYQPVLIKVYYHAGLKELAESCGFRSTTLKSLESCSNFKRTHCFLVQVWEALYREMVHTYINHTNPTGLLDNVKCILEVGIKES